MLSLCVTSDSDGSSTMAATVPAAQASTIAQRKRTDSRPASEKNVPTKAIVAGAGRNMLDRRGRKVASWQIRTATARRRARFPILPASTGSVISTAG